MHLEVIDCHPDGEARQTPLLFIHGAWHGAWCWDEHFLPYFAARGYWSYALSLRGHGQSDPVHIRWLRAADYLQDIAQVVASLKTPPVLIGHSMGGYLIQKALEGLEVPAVVLLAPIPVNGTLRFILHLMLTRPLLALRALAALDPTAIIRTPGLTRQFFYSPSLPSDRLRELHSRQVRESFAALVLDAALLNRPGPKRVRPTPMFVLGAGRDAFFTPRESENTARAYGADFDLMPDMAHNIMLEPDWQNAADRVLHWLAERGL